MRSRDAAAWGALALRQLALCQLALPLMAQSAGSADGGLREDRLNNGLRVMRVEIPKATEVSVALAVPVGWRHDPPGQTGLAEVMRWWIGMAQRELPDAAQFHVVVQPRLTLLWYTGPQRLLAQRIAFLVALLGGQLPVSADDHALASGRARRFADDHAWLYPGSVIAQRARRLVLAGTADGRQSLGIPQEIATVSRATVLARRTCYGPRGACLVLIGDPAEAWPGLLQSLRDVAGSHGRAESRVHDSAPPAPEREIHPRVSGPYVAAVVGAPEPTDPDFLPFSVGAAVLRSIAAQELPDRGSEWQARSPLVAYDYWEDARLLILTRRGRDGADPRQPASELRTLLELATRDAVVAARLEAARRGVASTLETPPYRSHSSPYLVVRARYLATAGCLGWPLDLGSRAAGVTGEQVGRVLRERLAADRLRWLELRPDPASPRAARTLRPR